MVQHYAAQHRRAVALTDANLNAYEKTRSSAQVHHRFLQCLVSEACRYHVHVRCALRLDSSPARTATFSRQLMAFVDVQMAATDSDDDNYVIALRVLHSMRLFGEVSPAGLCTRG